MEPLVEAIPVLKVETSRALPVANSGRYFTLDSDARLVADLTRKGRDAVSRRCSIERVLLAISSSVG